MAAPAADLVQPQPKTKALAKPGAEASACILGIDEAGRGPVLGPMVYAAAFCQESDEAAMKQMAFADSKTLKDEQREALFADIRGDGRLGYAIESVSASYISARMLRRDRVSLNQIANECTFDLITAVLDMGYRLSKVFVDTVGDADRHRERLKQRFPGIAFTVCPKADAIYPIVSAASIVAKVTRDVTLRDFAFREQMAQSRDWGSGYPGDPATKAWLEAAVHPLFGFPELTRFSWQTVSRMLEERGPKVTWSCDVDESAPSIAGFVQRSDAPQAASSGAGRPAFFRSRKLARMTTVF